MDNRRQVRVGLERQPPRSHHRAACLIIIMRDEKEIREGDIPAHDPFRILEVGIRDSVADRLSGALIGRQEGAAVHLIRFQYIDSPLQLLDDLADRGCWFVGAAIVHIASLP
jgi:hypothetical protein